MIKRAQNKVAESRYTLLWAALFGIAVWALCGLATHQLWVQFACFVLSVFLINQLGSVNALIRIYSQTVPAMFIALSCASCFIFPSLKGGIAQLCMVCSLFTLTCTYQDRRSPGWTFYTYMFLAMASLVEIHVLWFVPVYLLMAIFFYYSISWRTSMAAVLGLLMPYWFYATWTLWQHGSDFTTFVSHFYPVFDIGSSAMLVTQLPIAQLLSAGLLVVVAITGVIHYLRNSYGDKVRVRQLYYSLIFLNITATTLLLLLPQHIDLMIRLMIITASPLAAHFLTLTHTRITNVAFYALMATVIILTAINLWN